MIKVMRKRIATKVNVYAIGEDMRKKEERRRELTTLLLRDICNRDSVPMREAKITLKNEVKWSLMAKEVQALNV
jgi:hypothetical protein